MTAYTNHKANSEVYVKKEIIIATKLTTPSTAPMESAVLFSLFISCL